MALSSTNIHLVEQAPKILLPVSLSSSSLEAFQDKQVGLIQTSFQITSSSLGPGCEISYVSFKS